MSQLFGELIYLLGEVQTATMPAATKTKRAQIEKGESLRMASGQFGAKRKAGGAAGPPEAAPNDPDEVLYEHDSTWYSDQGENDEEVEIDDFWVDAAADPAAIDEYLTVSQAEQARQGQFKKYRNRYESDRKADGELPPGLVTMHRRNHEQSTWGLPQ